MKTKIKQYLEEIIHYLRKNASPKNENFAYYLLIGISFIVFAVGVNLFVELTEGVREMELGNFDEDISQFVTSFRNPGLTNFFIFITDIGDLYGYIIVTTLVSIFLFIKFRNWEFIIQLIGVVILASLSNLVLKEVINRARPGVEHLVVVETLSYPSGHSMGAMAFYGFLTYLLFQIKMSIWLRTFLASLFIGLIFAIGISRIYLGVHYPTDVLGGFIAGLIWIAFCVVLFNIIAIKRKRRAIVDPKEEEENLEE